MSIEAKVEVTNERSSNVGICSGPSCQVLLVFSANESSE